MASLSGWQWALIALGIALVAASLLWVVWRSYRQRRQSKEEKALGDMKQARVVVEASTSSSSPGSVSDDRSSPTPATTTNGSDTNSIRVVNMEKLDDHQLVLMPLSPRRQQKTITSDKSHGGAAAGGGGGGSNSGGDNETKYRVLVQQDESSRWRIPLSPFLAGVESPQPPPSRPDTNSSCSTAQSMLPKPVISSCLHQTWRGPTPPWTMPIE
ncbi:hypothetical protein BX666DRAFT_1437913 [Dichotomocladium elegans]|nr:hypothetical protein BX666DRAFT_1437913 [Dichotomocladium elegans]